MVIFEFMGGKRHHCCGNKLEKINKLIKEEINCVIFNAIIWKSINFVPPLGIYRYKYCEFVYTETRRIQPMPNNFKLNF